MHDRVRDLDVRNIEALAGPIAVLGGGGFVGAKLFLELLRHRSDVFAVVRGNKGWRLAQVPDEHIVALDLTDPAACRTLVAESAPATIFDCVAYGAYSFENDPELIYRTNFSSLVTLFSALKDGSCRAYIHAGSSSEYGENCSAPDEGDRCRPNSHYSVSKLAAAQFIEYMGNSGFPCVNLRLYSVYGPLEDTSRLMPNLVKRALAGELPPLVDPRTSRDFVHIDDVVRAFVLAAIRMNPAIYGHSFNIGSGVKTTIGELAEVARSTFSLAVTPQFGSMRAREWDLADWYANPAKATRELGWSATIALPEGLRAMADWIKTLPDDQFVSASKAAAATRKRSVAAIIACYGDVEAIPIMHERLTHTFQSIGCDYEIIFVNDGSPDDSEAVIQRLSRNDRHVIGITHSRNFGSQMAFRSGMEISSMDAVVLLDGDLQDPPELINDFYAKWEEGFDVIYGRRVRRDMPWFWGLLYKAFYRVFATFSYVQVPLDAGDFSLIDRRVVGWLLASPERDLFLRGLRAYVGFRQTGVDYVRPKRMFGRSTNNLLKNIDWAKKGIFSFSNTPITMLTAAGSVALLLSFFAAVLVAVLRLVSPDIAPRGVTTLLIATLAFGALNLFAIGLVGEYVAKILIEVKDRPRLIRSALLRNGEITRLLPTASAKKS
jgi:nucleoside-diphosphate-sugar epimerase/glycosyltransferase involved in cell wall biosynthesis